MRHTATLLRGVVDGVRVRFAPSPTGFLHLGGLRTALFNYLFAVKHNGTFILRLEDTDQSRLVTGAAEALQRDLAWAGLHIHEGPGHNEKCGPYVQSERQHMYKQYAEELLQSGHAYRCFCSTERLDAVRKLANKVGRSTAYDGHCRYLSAQAEAELLEKGRPYVVRLKVPRAQHDDANSHATTHTHTYASSSEFGEEVLQTVVEDANYGAVAFDNAGIDDQVLLKSDGFPTYHLANVVDDHMMNITHVLRGEEWLISTAKHELLYRAFGWTPPTFVHLPLLINPDGRKLSKRMNSLFVDHIRKEGVLPLALCNYVARLGWTPPADKENHVYPSLDDLARDFDLSSLNKQPAVVDPARMTFVNRRCLREASTIPLVVEQTRTYLQHHVVPALTPNIPHFDSAAPEQLLAPPYLDSVFALARESLDSLADVPVALAYLFVAPQQPLDVAVDAWDADVLRDAELATMLGDEVVSSSAHDFTADALKTAAKAWTKQHKLKMKSALKTLRFFITGQTAGPPVFAIMETLGRERCASRFNAALTRLRSR
ncbi:glutamyl-tRNA synthetase [Salpingoeca rosetta]|uniref:glutamate--tRNA ligase n=1 Tax=Salpingoeca rosetta (strain ATCC 50818 / BSB-021) TaxID=946362 RepID=F2TZV8_SALR5|nr:glutamyl-tRNA synthetase [Salpingoeca rosetta]EGD80686.1 glutamyl-tRNA synthetase [Salpingoeca rosetta]|eukprot:XP_004997247.1 glutamyl-tRNA synthetase [Salpingoeca rosetta]